MYLKRQHFLVGANFLAAIGGGIILTTRPEHGDTCLSKPIIPFFIGAVIGLLFGKIVPNRFTRSIARWFSITVALSSIILFVLAKAWCVNGGHNAAHAVVFSSLLSFRFGLWFFSRALRAQIVGSEKQGVALIELGYYSGAMLGLLGWQWLDSDLPTAFLVDALIQTAAGIIDLVVIGSLMKVNDRPAIARKEKTGYVLNFSHRHYLKLAVAVASLTVGFQGVWFAQANWSSAGVKKYIMPCFYFGVALSALVSKGFKLKLDWDGLGKHSRYAVISSELAMLRLKPSFGLIVTISAFTTILGLLALQWKDWNAYVPIFIIIAAFSYQILVLSLLDRIGRDESNENLTEEMIRETYIVAAVATIISILLLEGFAGSYLSGWILTIGCCVISFLAVRRSGRSQV